MTDGPKNRSSMRWNWVLIGLLAIMIMLPGLGRIPFIDRDEGEYATVAQEMIASSDYVIPHVNGRAYYEKPALFFWAMVGSFKLIGQNEFAGRLPSAAAGLALVFLMGWFGRRRGGDLVGLLAALMTATSFLFVLLARAAIVDMLLTLWTTLTLILFYEGYQSTEGRGRWYFRAAWAAMGLGFLTKGPVGVAVPLLAVFFLTLFNRDIWRTIRRSCVPTGLLLFVIAAGPWYVLAFWREGELFWQGFFISQNVTRYTEVLLGHGAPLWFYIPVLAILVWPWFFFAVPALWRGVIGNKLNLRRTEPDRALNYFLTVWFITSFVFFSLAATKQPNYVLPALPALILLAARWWRDALLSDRMKKGEFWSVLGLTALTGFGLAVFFFTLSHFLPISIDQTRAGMDPDSFEYAFPPANPEMGYSNLLIGVLMVGATAAALVAGFFRHFRAMLAVLTLGAVVFVGGMWHFTLPDVLDYLQTPARQLGLQVRETMTDNDLLASYGLYKPTLWFYTEHQIRRVRSRETERLSQLLAGRKRVFVLSRLSLLPFLSTEPNFHLWAIRGGYILGANRAFTDETRGEAAK